MLYLYYGSFPSFCQEQNSFCFRLSILFSSIGFSPKIISDMLASMTKAFFFFLSPPSPLQFITNFLSFFGEAFFKSGILYYS